MNARMMATGSVMIATNEERTLPEKNNADQRDRDAFFNQLFTAALRWRAGSLAPVVSRHDAHAAGRDDLISSIFFLPPSMT